MQNPEVMDLQTCAQYLGISNDTLYRYAAEGLVPAFKLGNRWRFKRELVDNWMRNQSNAKGIMDQIKEVTNGSGK